MDQRSGCYRVAGIAIIPASKAPEPDQVHHRCKVASH